MRDFTDRKYMILVIISLRRFVIFTVIEVVMYSWDSYSHDFF